METDHQFRQNGMTLINSRGVYRTQSNVHDGAFMQKQKTVRSLQKTFAKSCLTGIWQGPKYIAWEIIAQLKTVKNFFNVLVSK